MADISKFIHVKIERPQGGEDGAALPHRTAVAWAEFGVNSACGELRLLDEEIGGHAAAHAPRRCGAREVVH